MHRFKYKGQELYCEDTPVTRIARAVGTPFYLYSIGTVMDHYLKLKRAFAGLDCLICYSMKSNSNLTLLRKLVAAGAGLDIVSGGELYKAKKVGADPKKIVYASVGKTEAEVAAAVKAGILLLNVESPSELELINRVACRYDVIQDVAIRINPDVQPGTHRHLATGLRENKFGMDTASAYNVFIESYRYPFLRFLGIHLHIGSQITVSSPFIKAIEKAVDFVLKLRGAGIFIDTLNIGGGLGIIYSDERPQTADQFAKAVRPLLKKSNLKIILEPGRFISGPSGVLVTKVVYWKTAPRRTFAVVDAGMNDLIRPALYDAYHEILPVIRKRSSRQPRLKKIDIVGPVCESGDFLGRNRAFPSLSAGDLLAVMSCGAYGYAMSSNYNSRPRIPEVIVKGNRFFVSRRREIYQDLIRGEKILDV